MTNTNTTTKKQCVQLPWEHPRHWVFPLVVCGVVLTTKTSFDERSSLGSVACELVTEEHVGQIDLHEHVDEVERLADKYLDSPEAVVTVLSHRLDEISSELVFR